MRGSEFLDKLELLDPELVQAAAREPVKQPGAWGKLGSRLPISGGRGAARPEEGAEELPLQPRRFGLGSLVAIAMCLGAALLPVFLIRSAGFLEMGESPSMAGSGYAQYQTWREGFPPEDYFKFNPPESQGNTCIYLVDVPDSGNMPYTGGNISYKDIAVMDLYDPNQLSFTRAVNNARTAPRREGEYLYAGATFQGDEAVEARYRWEDFEPTDDFVYMVASTERKAWDEFEEAVRSSQSETVTVRDGVEIRAAGQEGFEKGLWFCKEGVWYRVYGACNTSAQFLAEVVDWIWTGEARPDRLDKDQGDVYLSRGLTVDLIEELAGDLEAYIPYSNQWCPALAGIELITVNGVGVDARCHYPRIYPPDDSKLITDWCVFLINDLHYQSEYVKSNSLGSLYSITREQVQEYVDTAPSRSSQGLLAFDWGAYKVEAGYQNTGNTADDLWDFLCYLRENMGHPDEVRQAWQEGFQPEDYFQCKSETVSSAVFTSFSSENQEQYYFSSQWPEGFAEAGLELPLAGDPVQVWAQYAEDGQVDRVVFTGFSQTADGGDETVCIACGPGQGDFSHFEGAFKGVTVTVRDGVEVKAMWGQQGTRLVYFQLEDGWYQILCPYGGASGPVGEAATYLFEHPVDFGFFQKEKGDSYTSKAVPPEGIPGELGRFTLIASAEATDYSPAISGADVDIRCPGGDESRGEACGVWFHFENEPDKLIQEMTLFVDSDRHFLAADGRGSSLELDALSRLGTEEELLDYIGEHCMDLTLPGSDAHQLVFDWDGYHVQLRLKEGATVQEVAAFVKEIAG